MKKIAYRIFISSILLVVSLIFYTVWDNSRIKIVEESIVMTQLPPELDGFSILQISDLHEKEFGKNQKKLLDIINSIDYDVLVFTGDLMSNPESTNYISFYQLLDGIINRDKLLYVSGNADPPSYQVTPAFDKSEFIKGMEEREVRFLESFETIDVLGENIHFVNFELSIIKQPEMIGHINGIYQPFHAGDERYQTYQTRLWEKMIDEKLFERDDIIIALNHVPISDPRIDYIESDPNTVWRDYDLIMAGHYHGGQIRLPFLGALFIPEPWYELGGLFPPQDRVKGLWEYKQTKQYVSAGLGSSDAMPLAKFRLFNPPEVNLVTIRVK